jgi:FSR family fosmidomycin resistance protein-like MFS transporter
MTQVAELPLPAAPRAAETRFVYSIYFAHFVSHYFMLLLAPLMIFIKDDFGVTYTELGLALTVFNIVSTVGQTPVGFLVDRWNARYMLAAGLLVGSAALAVSGLVNSFWVFIAMFAVLGLGNTVYHPADYALLGRHVPVERTGRVFAYHTFSGMLGNAAAPATLVYLYAVMGWRGAFMCAAVLGVAAAAVVLLTREPPEVAKPVKKKDEQADAPAAAASSWKLLLSAPILANLVFFILLSMSGGGLYNYLVATLGALHGTPATVANTALTCLLIMSAVGVLVGGQLTGYTSRYGLVTTVGLLCIATVCVLVGMIDFPALALIVLMSSVGFFNGLTMPSRDMIVRAAAPREAYGRVFGFVTSGFHLAGIVSPLIFGQMLDRGYPAEIFFFMAFCALLSIATVTYSTTRKPAS